MNMMKSIRVFYKKSEVVRILGISPQALKEYMKLPMFPCPPRAGYSKYSQFLWDYHHVKAALKMMYKAEKACLPKLVNQRT